MATTQMERGRAVVEDDRDEDRKLAVTLDHEQKPQLRAAAAKARLPLAIFVRRALWVALRMSEVEIAEVLARDDNKDPLQ